MPSEDTVYRKLQEHLDKQAVGFPATESGVDYYYTMPLLMGIAEGHGSKATPQFWADFGEYMGSGYGKAYAGPRISQMWTIPVRKSINILQMGGTNIKTRPVCAYPDAAVYKTAAI